jgi:acyl carrier protein
MNKELNNILIKYKLNNLSFNTEIRTVIDSLSMIRLILELDEKLKIKLKLNVNITISDIYEKIS